MVLTLFVYKIFLRKLIMIVSIITRPTISFNFHIVDHKCNNLVQIKTFVIDYLTPDYLLQ